MSTRIVDDHIAIKFPKDVLRAAYDHHTFYRDHFMFFELGGDNNLTELNFKTGREVRCRHWEMLAAGQKEDVMTEVVRLAVPCEGGGMRLDGERETKAETYIRRCRSAVERAVPFNSAGLFDSSVILKITSDPTKAPQRHGSPLSMLKALEVPEENEGLLEWRFRPLQSAYDAALFFVFRHLDERSVWNMAQVDGPIIDDELPRVLSQAIKRRDQGVADQVDWQKDRSNGSVRAR